MDSKYFDHSSTTEPHPSVVSYMVEALNNYYANPSSLHRKGLEVEKKINNAREIISKGFDSYDLIFTSSGTEANFLALKGILKKGDRLLISKVEHPGLISIAKELEKEGIILEYIPVEKNGFINRDIFNELLKKSVDLISIQAINQEIGRFEDLKFIGNKIKKKVPNAVFHVDGVQAFGKYPREIFPKTADLITISGHKINGPKGIGGLFVKKGLNIKPILIGGGQEKGFRGGTENVPGIFGFQRAFEFWDTNREEFTNQAKDIKKILVDELSSIEDMKIQAWDNGSPFILHVSFKDCRGEVLLHMLADEGFYVSTGSACAKGKESNVLKAINIGDEYIDGSIRISIGPYNTKESALKLASIIKLSVEDIRKIIRRK